MKKETIFLYNHYHYGDIFLSRIIVKYLIDHFDIKYYHNLKHGLLSDIDGVEEIIGIPVNFDINSSNFDNKQINTWIGQKNFSYLTKVNNGFSVENYMVFVQEVLNFFNIEVKSGHENLPTINYNKLSGIEELTNFLNNSKHNFKKLVLVSNGPVMSGQAINFDFTSIIEKLSKNYPNILFIVTQKIHLNLPNIVYTTDIAPELLQISYASTFCDFIVGRSSGPYTYSATKENLLNPNKTFIGFTFKPIDSKYYESSLAKMVWSSNFDESNVYNMIVNEINNSINK